MFTVAKFKYFNVIEFFELFRANGIFFLSIRVAQLPSSPVDREIRLLFKCRKLFSPWNCFPIWTFNGLLNIAENQLNWINAGGISVKEYDSIYWNIVENIKIVHSSHLQGFPLTWYNDRMSCILSFFYDTRLNALSIQSTGIHTTQVLACRVSEWNSISKSCVKKIFLRQLSRFDSHQFYIEIDLSTLIAVKTIQIPSDKLIYIEPCATSNWN